MIKAGMLSFIARSRAARLFLGLLFLWTLLPVQSASGNQDPSRVEQREYFTQAQGCSLPALVENRGKHSAEQQLTVVARTLQDAFEAFERTITAERATVIRAFTPLPAHVVYTQHTTSDL